MKCSAFGNNKECQSLNFYLNWHLSNKANMLAGCKLSSICQYQVYLCWCRNEWSLFNFHWHQMRKLHKENCNLSLQQCPFGKSMNEPLRLNYLPKLCITYILKDMYIFFFFRHGQNFLQNYSIIATKYKLNAFISKANL